MAKPNLHIAIAILLHQDQVLVGWRDAQQHQGNKNEFPGGKVEEGESPVEACSREVLEEVGINLSEWHHFDFIRHEYDDVIVNLHIFHGVVPSSMLESIREPWQWYRRDELLDLNFPKANKAMLKRLYWQQIIKISDQLSQLAEVDDTKLMYWRTDATQQQQIELSEIKLEDLSRLIVNIELWKKLNSVQQQSMGAVHLKQQQCLQLNKGDLQQGVRYIAACHDLASVLHASRIGCDAVLLSPVKHTETHSETQPLGWQAFASIAQQVDIPVFALGGMHSADLIEAKQHHAYGIAGIRFV
ncbi:MULTISPECIES: NUDIX domain-containing protein [Acinetobacter]|uniref:NUDIX domain-containing protein n=1 Tax=Acinetobacter TaxID=469 RepID=UPI000EA18F04|nr:MULTISPECIES: NUDIX domain-containing protein [Acinetobacter]RKG41807.1 NUDIX domain-containing protein [Acinetobacter cumulans]RZG57774.1 NUDIX domain-containing protein [Acinetobacter sp. WCHAc060006]